MNDSNLAERESLLTSALIAVVEALRMNPDKYAVIYNSKYDDNDNIFESSNSATSSAISSHPYSQSKVPRLLDSPIWHTVSSNSFQANNNIYNVSTT